MRKELIDRLVQETYGSYSYDRYRSWRGVVAMLLREGYTEQQIVAILMSKWTRWAADAGGKPYGKATAADLLKFVKHPNSAKELDSLVAEHFAVSA